MSNACIANGLDSQALCTQLTESLKRWWDASADELFAPRTDELIYGTGYNTWGVQTQQKALAAVAYLASQGDESAAGQAIEMLRYNLRSHIEGPHACTDEESWGHTWISVLGIERMMFVIEELRDKGAIPNDLEDELKQVLISEADWLLHEYEIVAGLVDNNKPESNIWNGAILHRVALLYPDAPNAAAYMKKGDTFLYNGISIESDLINDSAFKSEIVGANFFETMSLNHHRYLNVGYMVICLSNVAMLHFSYKRLGKTAPEALYHHADKLWSLVKMLTFEDGRLWRVGGDTRVRYCYCQDYALPMWLLVEDYFGEDCGDLIKGWCDQVFTEQDHNADNLYLSERLSTMKSITPLYFTRLESDRAATLAMTAAWLPMVDRESLEGKPVTQSQWFDDYHGALVQRDETRRVSWVWDGGEGPTGTCVPAQRSDMAEWCMNLLPKLTACGDRNNYSMNEKHMQQFDGGFATIGSVRVMNVGNIFEGGQQGHHLADIKLACIALPDQATTLVFQYVQAAQTHQWQEIRGLQLKMPNELWNDFKREFAGADDRYSIVGNDGRASLINAGKHVLIDDALAVQLLYQNSELDDKQGINIVHQDKRGTGLKHLNHCQVQRAGGFMYTEDLCAPYIHTGALFRVRAGTLMVDTGVAMSTDPSSSISVSEQSTAQSAQKSFHVNVDGAKYAIAINFSDEAQILETNQGRVLAAAKQNGQALEALGFQLIKLH